MSDTAISKIKEAEEKARLIVDEANEKKKKKHCRRCKIRS